AAWQKEITDNQEYLQTLKFDALQHRNLVFSPIGDVYDLPAGATPIDYAYAVHTDLGHQANGAKVNGKMVPLNHKLVNGDVVEIMIDRKRAKPSHAWLSFVVTTTARHQITKALKN
ncbi:bifunctional (p)ppGpp synthetase/guanosine-3',5'-bis(diphosphate) 3'-pyrophosphohydrolase, partial [Candidatus Amesbacteria bacterium]|nr:bifunctional (p)ppGpp synthetase/guanosine-3',5'-bis(diphosphate) 3'-pyrophosphohydrolase [Candidatus Amesbacteria bacterium]